MSETKRPDTFEGDLGPELDEWDKMFDSFHSGQKSNLDSLRETSPVGRTEATAITRAPDTDDSFLTSEKTNVSPLPETPNQAPSEPAQALAPGETTNPSAFLEGTVVSPAPAETPRIPSNEADGGETSASDDVEFGGPTSILTQVETEALIDGAKPDAPDQASDPVTKRAKSDDFYDEVQIAERGDLGVPPKLARGRRTSRHVVRRTDGPAGTGTPLLPKPAVVTSKVLQETTDELSDDIIIDGFDNDDLASATQVSAPAVFLESEIKTIDRDATPVPRIFEPALAPGVIPQKKPESIVSRPGHGTADLPTKSQPLSPEVTVRSARASRSPEVHGHDDDLLLGPAGILSAEPSKVGRIPPAPTPGDMLLGPAGLSTPSSGKAISGKETAIDFLESTPSRSSEWATVRPNSSTDSMGYHTAPLPMAEITPKDLSDAKVWKLPDLSTALASPLADVPRAPTSVDRTESIAQELDLFEKEVELSPGSAELRQCAARAAELLGDLHRAKEHYAQLRRLDERDVAALRGQRRIALSLGLMDDVITATQNEKALVNETSSEAVENYLQDLIFAYGDGETRSRLAAKFDDAIDRKADLSIRQLFRSVDSLTSTGDMKGLAGLRSRFTATLPQGRELKDELARVQIALALHEETRDVALPLLEDFSEYLSSQSLAGVPSHVDATLLLAIAQNAKDSQQQVVAWQAIGARQVGVANQIDAMRRGYGDSVEQISAETVSQLQRLDPSNLHLKFLSQQKSQSTDNAEDRSEQEQWSSLVDAWKLVARGQLDDAISLVSSWPEKSSLAKVLLDLFSPNAQGSPTDWDWLQDVATASPWQLANHLLRDDASVAEAERRLAMSDANVDGIVTDSAQPDWFVRLRQSRELAASLWNDSLDPSKLPAMAQLLVSETPHLTARELEAQPLPEMTAVRAMSLDEWLAGTLDLATRSAMLEWKLCVDVAAGQLRAAEKTCDELCKLEPHHRRALQWRESIACSMNDAPTAGWSLHYMNLAKAFSHDVVARNVFSTRAAFLLAKSDAATEGNRGKSGREEENEATTMLADASTALPTFDFAARLWFDLAARAGHFGQLAEFLETQASKAEADDKKSRIKKLFMAAVVWMDHTEEWQKAADDLRAVLNEEPTHREAFWRLKSIYESHDQIAALTELLEARLSHIGDDLESYHFHRLLGHIHRVAGDDLAAAKRHWHKVFLANEGDTRALAALAELSWDLNDWDDAAQYMSKQLGWISEPQERFEIFSRLAEIYSEKAPHPTWAMKAWEEALAIDPAHIPTWQKLLDLYVAQEQWKQALRAGEQMVALAHDKHDKVKHLLQMASILEAGAGDKARAEKVYHLALEVDPVSEPAVAGLMAFYEKSHDRASQRIYLDKSVLSARAELRKELSLAALSGLARGLVHREALVPGSKYSAHIAAEVARYLGSEDSSWDALARRSIPHVPFHNLVKVVSEEGLFPEALSAQVRAIYRIFATKNTKSPSIDLSKYGVSRSERLRSGNPLLEKVTRWAKAIGYPEIEVFVSQYQPTVFAVEPTQPASFVIGSGLADLPDAELQFMVTGSLIVNGLHLSLPCNQSESDLTATLAGLLKWHGHELPSHVSVDATRLVAESQRLKKTFSSSTAAELAHHTAELARDFAPGRIFWAVKQLRARVGFLHVGGLGPAFAVLWRMQNITTLDKALEDPVASDLVWFGLGDDAARIWHQWVD